MSSFLCCNLMGTGNCKISSGPKSDIIRKCSAGTGNKVCNALQTGQFHIIPCFFLIFIFRLFFRRIAGQKPFNHILKKSVFRRKLGSSTESNFSDFIYSITLFPVCTGETYTDMIFSQPSKKTDKTGIDLQNIRTDRSTFFIKFKGSPMDRIGENTTGMVLPFSLTIIKNQNGLLRSSLRFL